MSGRHPFDGLTKDCTPERRQRIGALKNELIVEMPLHELRWARALTQRGPGEQAEGEPACRLQAGAEG